MQLSRNKREGQYCGKVNGEQLRERNKKYPKLLGWKWIDRCVEDEYETHVRPFLNNLEY